LSELSEPKRRDSTHGLPFAVSNLESLLYVKHTNVSTAYYKTIVQFKDAPMKDISPVLSTLWETDPNKPLWSLLSKTWSILRDEIGAEQAPLYKFFQLLCPALLIPSPDTYLDRFGWVLEYREGGTFHLHRAFIPPDVAAGFPEPIMSIGDIIRFCHANGFAQAYILDKRILPTTFLVREANRTPNGADVIEDMEKKRIEKLNKRRAARKAKRDSIPADIKKRLTEVRAADRKLKAQNSGRPFHTAPGIVTHEELAHLATTNLLSDIPTEPTTGLVTQPTAQIDFFQPPPPAMQSTDEFDFTQPPLLQNGADTNVNTADGLDFPVHDYIMQNLDTYLNQENAAAMTYPDAPFMTDEEILQFALQPGADGEITLPEYI
jgi:hypothetical protein